MLHTRRGRAVPRIAAHKREEPQWQARLDLHQSDVRQRVCPFRRPHDASGGRLGHEYVADIATRHDVVRDARPRALDARRVRDLLRATHRPAVDAYHESRLAAAEERSGDLCSACDRHLRWREERDSEALLADLIQHRVQPASRLIRGGPPHRCAQLTRLPASVLPRRPAAADLYAQHMRGRRKRGVLLRVRHDG